MLDLPGYQGVLAGAVQRLLRPLFRLLLRHGMSYVAFEALARRVFVEVAMQDFALEGRKPSISRASILSGLTRKEVQRLAALPLQADPAHQERYNRAARVLTAWLRSDAFRGPDGEPRPLALDGDAGFAGLVRRHSGDVPARAVLDELVRVGAVRRRDDHTVELVARAYVPSQSVPDKLAILGTDVADLIDTIDHNILVGAAAPRFQRKVMYHRIPADVLPEFRQETARQGQALLERLDRWLQAHDEAQPSAAPGSASPACARVGLGIFQFEEAVAPPSRPQGDSP